MAFATGFDKSEAQFLVTLCDLSYEDEKALPGESIADQQQRLRNDINGRLGLPRSADWTVAWGPVLSDDRANMMYAAENQHLQQCAVVVRGTDWDYIEDWLQDLFVTALVDFSQAKGAPNGAQIAKGTSVGLDVLIAMQDTGSEIADFVTQRIQDNWDVFVTGHSLGGCLASVLAYWLAKSAGASTDHVKVYTFAAPSAGNKVFADDYNALFAIGTVSTALRVYNDIDIVPKAWASLPDIAKLFDPAPRCPPELKMLVATAAAAARGQYFQVGIDGQSAWKLSGTVVPAAVIALLSLTEDKAFMSEIDRQHGTDTYLNLLSALP